MKGRSCVYCGKAGIIVATYCLCIVFLKYTPGFISHGPFINLKRNSCLNRSNLPFLSFYFFFFFLSFSFFFLHESSFKIRRVINRSRISKIVIKRLKTSL